MMNEEQSEQLFMDLFNRSIRTSECWNMCSRASRNAVWCFLIHFLKRKSLISVHFLLPGCLPAALNLSGPSKPAAPEGPVMEYMKHLKVLGTSGNLWKPLETPGNPWKPLQEKESSCSRNATLVATVQLVKEEI